MAIDRLRPDPANPRRIEKDEVEALIRSIRQYGFVQPIVATRDRTVVAGHQRLIAARRLGHQTVPVIFVDLSTAEARTLGLALNKISGRWDEQLLAHLIADLQDAPGLDLSLSGFGEDEITSLLRSLDAREKRDRPEAFDLDAALEAATTQPRTQPGDLWILGEHRLLAGDATQANDVARVLDGRRADLGVLDPPGSTAYRGRPAPVAKRRPPIASDDLDPEAFAEFVRAWAQILMTVVDGALYIFLSSKELPLVSQILVAAGGHWSDTIIWSKGVFTLGRADLQRGYEPIWYGWREGANTIGAGAAPSPTSGSSLGQRPRPCILRANPWPSSSG